MTDDVELVATAAPQPFNQMTQGEAPASASDLSLHLGKTASDGVHIDFMALDDASAVDPALFETSNDELPFARQMMATPLHFSVASESLTNLWCGWNGYTVAECLTNIEDEYAALRHSAALMDISPLSKYRISGPDAFVWLRRLVAGNLTTLGIDESLPVVFCEDRGDVVGDGLLFRLGASEFRLVTEEAHTAWLMDSTLGHRVRIDDVSANLAAMSLQGPLSSGVLLDAGFSGIENLRPYEAHWFEAQGMPVYVSRSGNSGDPGYELWVEPDDAPALWQRLLDKGRAHGVRAGGFALREIARIEAGIPRAGRDYIGAFSAVDPASASNPFELGFAPLVDLEGDHFTGREALRMAKDTAPRHILAMLAVDWHMPLSFGAIHTAAGIVGLATSTAFSPALGHNLALAMLKPQALTDGTALHIRAEIREELSVRIVDVPARILPGPALSLLARHLVPASRGVRG